MRRKIDDPLTEVEKFCLDSLAVNGNLDLAYSLSHPHTKEGDYKHVLALRWKRSDLVKTYMAEQSAKLLLLGGSRDEATAATLKTVDFTQRTNLIQALSDAANIEKDTLRRTKILSELADLQQMDKEEHKEDKELIHYYLPLTCKRCSLYCAAQAEREKQEGLKFGR
jgi:hypothetical protein